MSNEFWMSNLNSDLLKKPLNCLYIPGSHDSFTRDIIANSAIGPDARLSSLCLIKLTRYYGKKFLKPWLITQNYSAFDQLNYGVRYFDLRIGIPTSENADFHITHQLFSKKLSIYLDEIVTFLNDHPKEVVLLDFNHIYLNEKEHNTLSELIIKIFGDKILPYDDSEIPSLNTLWKLHHQVLIFYKYNGVINKKFWPSSSIPSYWPNTTDTEQMIQFLKKSLKKKEENKFHVSQGILTPTCKTIACNPFSSLENCLADKASQAVLEWLHDLQEYEKENLNIVIVDFVRPTGVINEIINLNLKRYL